MNDDKHSPHQGMPWPEPYADLRPVIEAQWGMGGEIYLISQLSGGRSGAMVFHADVTGEDFAGQAILKLDRAPDPEWQEKSEAERHRIASEGAPEFAAKHLPTILHTAHHGENLAILSSIAGRGLEYALPWSACDHARQQRVVRRVSRGILEDWNRNAELAPGLQMPKFLLEGWLGYRLDPERGRLFAFLQEHCGLPPDEPAFTFEGQWYPNPLAFAISDSERVSHLKLRAVTGHTHNDLHGLNVLVSNAGSGTEDHFYLIDLALYQEKQFLFYDHGYFALSHLLAVRGQAPASHWQAILDELCPFDQLKSTSGLFGDDVGLIALLKSLRQEVFDWVNRHQANRLSYMESQFQLAQIAVGLNFAHKQISERQRRLAFLFAATILKHYLRLHDVDWPKYGPAFSLDGQSVPLTDAADTAVSSGEEATTALEYPELPEQPAIAVLAFENQSDDPQQEYFADGVTDEIILELSRIDWLMVISRGSTFSYKGKIRRPEADRARAGRPLPGRGHCTQDGRPRARHRSAGRCPKRPTALGGALRPTPRGHLRAAGRNRHRHRRQHRRQAEDSRAR